MEIKNRIISVMLCIFSIFMMMPVTVLAEGKIIPNQDVDVQLIYKDEDILISGAMFEIFKVANVDEYAKMTVTDDFSAYPISFQGISQEGWKDLALTLKGYVKRDKDILTAEETVFTDSNGEKNFVVKPGLYLIIGSRRTIGEYTYTAAPFLLFVPRENKEENIWDYSVNVYPKFTKAKNPSDIPEDKYITRKAIKIWDDAGFEDKRPEEVEVSLLQNGEVFDTKILSEENNWYYAWDDLDADQEWLIVEKELKGYYTKVSFEGITFTVKNTFISPIPGNEPTAVKVITGDKPDSSSKFEFVLEAQEGAFPMPEGSRGSVKEMIIEGEGTASFGEITFTQAGTYYYKIYEKDGKAEGYTYDSSEYFVIYNVTQIDSELSITKTIKDKDGKEVSSAVFSNRYDKPGKDIPYTGVTWWPVPVLLTAGLVLCIIGCVIRNRKNYEK